MAEDAAPLIDAVVAIIEASRAYLPPDGIGKDEFITRVLEAVDNPRIIAARSPGRGVIEERWARWRQRAEQ